MLLRSFHVAGALLRELVTLVLTGPVKNPVREKKSRLVDKCQGIIRNHMAAACLHKTSARKCEVQARKVTKVLLTSLRLLGLLCHLRGKEPNHGRDFFDLGPGLLDLVQIRAEGGQQPLLLEKVRRALAVAK